MNDLQRCVVRFRRLLAYARNRGIVLVADGDHQAVRFMSQQESDEADDLREAGTAVKVDNGCGTQQARVSGDACKFGNL